MDPHKWKEHFLAFKDFSWFGESPISLITSVELIHSHHHYWADLDVDLELVSLENPEKYPLIVKQQIKDGICHKPILGVLNSLKLIVSSSSVK